MSLPLSTLEMSTVVGLKFTSEKSGWWDFIGATSDISNKYNFTANLGSSGFCRISAFFSAMLLKLYLQVCFVDVFTGTELYNFAIDWLWFSRMITMFCKEKFLCAHTQTHTHRYLHTHAGITHTRRHAQLYIHTHSHTKYQWNKLWG